MSDQQEMEAANVGLGPPDGVAEGELLFNVNLSQKPQDIGDGGDVSAAALAESPLPETGTKKTEVNEDASVKSHRREKSDSPTSKRLSKRKRKNRRRREKKATTGSTNANTTEGARGGALSGVEDCTGTETETDRDFDMSQNSETKGDDTGTESEGTGDLDKDVSSMCVEVSNTTVPSIPEEDFRESVMQANSLDSTCYKFERDNEEESGPTHSVDTLLKIAKCKILSQVMDLPGESAIANAALSDSNDSSIVKLIVPPCSPSSLHSINNMGNSTDSSLSNVPQGTQKSSSKNVHFEEGPPQVVTVEANPSEEVIFELKLENTNGQQNATKENPAMKNTSKETIVLNLIGNTDSATSSIASEASASSLLKGNESSSEEFVESSHYPSREIMEDSDGQTASGINTAAFRETIQIFKIQNPRETQQLGNEVDSILTKSVDKFNTLMENTAGSDDNTVPVFVSGKRDDDVNMKALSQQNDVASLNDESTQNQPVLEPSGEIVEDADESTNSGAVLGSPAPDSVNVDLNTTFTIEKESDEAESVAEVRPMSAGEVLPRPIPDTVSDTESVGAAGLSVVVEEEEDEDDDGKTASIKSADENANMEVEEAKTDSPTPSLMQSVSNASTVIERVASKHSKSDTSGESVTINQSEPEGASGLVLTASSAASETESANEEESRISNQAIKVTPAQALTSEQEQVMVELPEESFSSAKSSVSSPRHQDANENSLGTVAPEIQSRPSTGESGATSVASVLSESEHRESTEPKRSVEVFTLHFPVVTGAPPSENNLDSGNGDQPYLDKSNYTKLLSVEATASSQERKDGTLGRETETDSDTSWVPDRKTLEQQQVALEREDTASIEVHDGDASTRRNVENTTGQQPDETEEEENDGDSKGCCAKMCVIT